MDGRCDVEVFVVVSSGGDYASGATEESACEAYDNDVGSLSEAGGYRVVCVKLSVPLPSVVQVSGSVADYEAVGPVVLS